jgi:pyruvate formate lyase activating enzyme
VVTGRVFNIQDLSVQDGPGIRTTVFLKGCPLRCAWCCNPEGQAGEFDIQFMEGLCRSCRQCLEVCPSSAVRIGADGRPRFRREMCRRCLEKTCVEVCSGRALRASGRETRLSEIARRIEANKSFYRNSGGGVTLSGGEPLRQPAFARAMVEDCRRRGVSVGLETCGAFEWSEVEDFIAAFDFIYFDLKCGDGERHRRWTGRSNTPILANLRRLARIAAPRIIVTLTLVPGFNDDPKEWSAIAGFCRESGVRRVRLLEYHDLGKEKYRSLGRKYALADGPELKKTVRPACAAFLRAKGLKIERE